MKDLRVLLIKLAKEQQVAVVISSHILAEIELICDSVVMIREGHIIDKSEINRQQGSAEERVPYLFKVIEMEFAKSLLRDIDLHQKIQFQDEDFKRMFKKSGKNSFEFLRQLVFPLLTYTKHTRRKLKTSLP
ncbi:hypothetical protein ACOI1C_17470 [Bacillus sp. DJP31]|uniref:hypothetical protein n=1 Tax=Bacillus sp. DJP31 TaxID=3409789 RepID=UPI003BB80A06